MVVEGCMQKRGAVVSLFVFSIGRKVGTLIQCNEKPFSVCDTSVEETYGRLPRRLPANESILVEFIEF
jgi:hypothetical protein